MPPKSTDGLIPLVFPHKLVSDSKESEHNGVYTLFAVSYDIGVGDVVYHDDGTLFGTIGSFSNEGGRLTYVDDMGLDQGNIKHWAEDADNRFRLFKVLGPISEGAIWVKEGEVIEVQRWERGILLLEDREYYKVLGPCGHYH